VVQEYIIPGALATIVLNIVKPGMIVHLTPKLVRGGTIIVHSLQEIVQIMEQHMNNGVTFLV